MFYFGTVIINLNTINNLILILL